MEIRRFVSTGGSFRNDSRFLVIALIAGILGIWPVEALSRQIAWILFVIFLVLFVLALVLGRRGPPV